MNGSLSSCQAPRLRALVLAGCAAGFAATAQPADVDMSKPQPKGVSLTPAKIELPVGGRIMELSKWKATVLPMDVVGDVASGLFCSDKHALTYTKKIDDWIHFAVGKAFVEEAVRYGFSTPEETISVFDDKTSNGVDFRLGATLMALDYRTCGTPEQKGSVYSKVKWEVFSVRRQQVVYSTVVESTYANDRELSEKEFDVNLTRGIVDNLLADPALVAVIRSGGLPASAQAAALPALQVDPGQQITAGVDKGTSKILAAVATVESGVGSGSGFYISQDGYLLTNQHVVADDKFVRVKLSSGRSMVGEVVRVDKARDVALLRTDPVAAEVLALRTDGGTVGEPVYAVGSPFGQSLSGTITRGVLSARRVIEGVAFLQSDVAINPGNSGGPLLDGSGRVIGITVLGSHAQGINLFIPLDDVVDKLALTLQAKPAVASATPASTATRK